MNKGFTYILTNKNKTVLYIGVTNNIERRMTEHKSMLNKQSFTYKYNCTILIYYEEFQNIEQAILREKQLKNWHREWKWNLAKSINPDLIDLSNDWQ